MHLREQRLPVVHLAVLVCWSLVIAYALVRQSAVVALALVIVPPVLLWVVTRPHAGLMAAVALVLVVPYWRTFGSAQVSVLRVAAVLACITFLMARKMKLCPTDLALAAFVVVLVLDWLLQYDQPHSGRILTTELTPIGLYLGARGISAIRVRPLFWTILIAGTVGALTVLYEFARGSVAFADPNAYVWNASDITIFRPGGIFGSPPGAATVLAAVILFGLALLPGSRGARKAFAISCLVLCGAGEFVTFTRGPLIGIAVGVLLFLWLTRSPLLNPKRIAMFIVFGSLAIWAVLPLLQNSLTFQEGVLRGGTLTQREGYWQTAMPIATSSVHNFVFGIGTGTLETPTSFNDVTIASAEVIRPQVFTNSLHNEYVTTLVEQGLIGVASLLLLLLSPISAAAFTARRKMDPFAASAPSVIVAVGITMAVDTVLFHGPSTAMLLLALGFAARASTLASGVGQRGRSGAD